MCENRENIFIGFGYREEKDGEQKLLNDLQKIDVIHKSVIQILTHINFKADYSMNSFYYDERI